MFTNKYGCSSESPVVEDSCIMSDNLSQLLVKFSILENTLKILLKTDETFHFMMF